MGADDLNSGPHAYKASTLLIHLTVPGKLSAAVMLRFQSVAHRTVTAHFWPWLFLSISLLLTPNLTFTPLCFLVTA